MQKINSLCEKTQTKLDRKTFLYIGETQGMSLKEVRPSYKTTEQT
jgi:hypothetical protein